MSARAKKRADEGRRHLKTAAEERARDAYLAAADRPWLNGWHRDGIDSVRMGTVIHCIGCGRLQGVVCTVFGPDWSDWVRPPDPVWPFTVDDCPLCSAEARRRAEEIQAAIR